MKAFGWLLAVIASSLAISLTSCVSTQTSFIKLGQPAISQTDTRPNLWVTQSLSDALALNYADIVATSFRSQGNGLRVTREVSNSMQVTLAALGGAGAIFGFSDKTLAILGLGGSNIPAFQKIFSSAERATAYTGATRLIEEAIIEYLSFNQRPSDRELTQNGVTLIQRVTASVHLVEKTLTGSLATVEDLDKATEPMSPAGAIPTAAGSPSVNNIAANREAAKEARLKLALKRGVRIPSPPPAPPVVNADPVTQDAFISSLEKLIEAKEIKEDAENPIFGEILTSAGVPTPHILTANGVLDAFEGNPSLRASLLKAVREKL